MDSTAQLVQEASRGDEPALHALLARYLPELRAFLWLRAGRRILARESLDDLTQSVCREVLERLADGRFRYEGDAQFREWLYRAAVMKMTHRHRHWRAEKRDPGREVRPVADADASHAARGVSAVADPGSTPSQDAIRFEELERFREAFSGLSERDQRLIQLQHAEGRTHAEIADELGISEASSRMALSRALGRLAKRATRG